VLYIAWIVSRFYRETKRMLNEFWNTEISVLRIFSVRKERPASRYCQKHPSYIYIYIWFLYVYIYIYIYIYIYTYKNDLYILLEIFLLVLSNWTFHPMLHILNSNSDVGVIDSLIRHLLRACMLQSLCK
jgi:hypothetical protein